MKMEMVLTVIANIVVNFATLGVGFRSMGILYQPEIPKELL